MILSPIIPAKRKFYSYEIPRSCRINDDDTAYLYRTPVSVGNRQKWTLSTGIKRGNIGSLQSILTASNNADYIRFGANDKLSLYFVNGADGVIVTSMVFRDPTAWYYILIAVDTTQATASDRVKIYVNGTQITNFDTETYPSLNLSTSVNNAVIHRICNDDNSYYFDGYLAETYLIDGQALSPTDFGRFKYGIFIPKRYTGTYGTNGFHLDFANSADLGNDVSGKNNDFTVTNLTSDDQVDDTPTNNYCVMSPIYPQANTFADGNLTITTTAAGTGQDGTISTILANTGKWYWEVTADSGTYYLIGIVNLDLSARNLYGYDGQMHTETAAEAYGSTYGTTDIIGVAIDRDADTVTFYLNNVSQGALDISRYADEDIFAYFSDANASSADRVKFNFGQLGFTYTPPAGFKALCTANLPIPTVKNSAEGFVQTTASGSTIASDLASLRSGWPAYIDILKNRSASEDWEWIFSDDPTNSIHSNTPDEKGPKQTLVGANSYYGGSIRVGHKYGVYTAEVPHTTGTDTTQAHGLSGTKFAAIAHRVSIGGGDWWMEHPGLTANYNIRVNLTNAETSTQYVTVDGTNITIKGAAPSGTYRVIVLRETDGFLSLDYYIGNASTDGPVTLTGHRTQLLMIKPIGYIDNFRFLNKAMNKYNPRDTQLTVDDGAGEFTSANYNIDFLSGGFKIRTSMTGYNGSGKHITISIGDQSLKYANAASGE